MTQRDGEIARGRNGFFLRGHVRFCPERGAELAVFVNIFVTDRRCRLGDEIDVDAGRALHEEQFDHDPVHGMHDVRGHQLFAREGFGRRRRAGGIVGDRGGCRGGLFAGRLAGERAAGDDENEEC